MTFKPFLNSITHAFQKIELTRTGKALLSFFSFTLTQITTILVNLLITPFLLIKIGSELFGTGQIINQYMNVLSFFDLRPLNSLKYSLSTLHTADDSQKRRQVGSSLTLWLCTLPLLISISLIFIIFSSGILKVNPLFVPMVRFCLIISFFNLIMNAIFYISAAILLGVNLAYKGMGIRAFASVVSGLISVLLVWNGWNLLGIFLANLIGDLVLAFLYFVIAKKSINWLGIEKPSKNEFAGFTKYSFWLSAANFSSFLLYQSDIIIIGAILSPVAVTSYVLTRVVMDRLVLQGINLFNSSISGIGQLIETNKQEKIRDLRIEMQSIALLFLSIFGSGVIIFNQSFISMWVGQEKYAGDLFNLIAVIAATQPLFSTVDIILLDLYKISTVKTRIYLLSGIVNVIASIILIQSLNLVGYVIANTIAKVLFTLQINFAINKQIEQNHSNYFIRLIRPTIIWILILILSVFIKSKILISSWRELIIYSLGISFLCFITTWWGGLSKDIRINVVNRVPSLPKVLGRVLCL